MCVPKNNPQIQDPITHPRRPLIHMLFYGCIARNDEDIRVVLQRDKISVGCTDVTPQVLQYLLDEHKKKFNDREVVLQSGPVGHPC